MNEDTTGEAAALRKELRRVREELARYKQLPLQPAQQHQAGAGSELPWAEGFGSPLRFPALRTISGSPLMASPGTGTQQVRVLLPEDSLCLEQRAEEIPFSVESCSGACPGIIL